jgi:hypothetical protein
VLRGWLMDPSRRQQWRDAAAAQRPRLPTWRMTAEAVLSHLAELSEPR